MVSRALLLKMADSPTIERFVKKNGMSSGFARRFVAGETMEETIDPVRALNAKGIPVSLDYLGENVSSESAAMESVAYYHRLFDFIAHNALDANVSLKLTQLGLDLTDDLAYSNMVRILERAEEHKRFVRIDMEGSAYTQRTLDIFYRLWKEHKNVGAVIQSYLYRSPEDVQKLIEVGARVRLVKGAYSEPKEVAYQSKADVDQKFVDLMRPMLDRGNYPAIATHDEQMIHATVAHAKESDIESSRFEFQMLYGIRRERQLQIVRDGFRMRVYVPFGTQWYAYMMRRMAERPANLWFVMKNLVRR